MKKFCFLFILASFFFIQSVNAQTIINSVNNSGKNMSMSDSKPIPKDSLAIAENSAIDIGFSFTPDDVSPGEYVIVAEVYGKWGVMEELQLSVKSGYDPFTFEVTKLGNVGRCWVGGAWYDNCKGYRIAFFVNFSKDDSIISGYLRSQNSSSLARLTYYVEDSSRNHLSVMTSSDYQIWKSQNETNEKLDDIQNSINSDDSDASSSKCGILCKLKNIVTGIAQLPGKIGEFIVNLGKQIGQFFSDLTTSISGFFKDLISNMSKFFSDLLNGIKNALTSLGNFLIEGIKGLFVPTNDQLYEIINDSKKLSENFGFVGESINFFINIFTSLLGMVNQGGCVELPEFSVGPTSMFEKVTFWNKQNVCLSDNQILSMHIDTIRTITSIVLVCLFINFAASKFFSILSKNDSGTTTNVDLNGNVTSYEWSNVNGDRTVRRRQ